MTANQTLTSRDTLIRRLHEDLIGPRAADEILEARPSDVYLTGILWPKNTALAPEEDERLAVGSGEEGDDAEDQAQAQSVRMRRPSTAGVSFASRSPGGGSPAVLVAVRFGTYRQVEGQKGRWQRHEHEPEPLMVTLDPGAQNYPVVVEGIAGIRLNVRTVPFERGLLSTVTLVNEILPEEQDRAAAEKATLFQVELRIEPAPGSQLIARPSRRAPVDEEDWSSALLYRHAREFAAGHTCSADWDDDPESVDLASSVSIAWLPEATVPAVSPDGHAVFDEVRTGSSLPLSAAWLANAETGQLCDGLHRLCNAYEAWIRSQEAALEELGKEKGIAAEFVDAGERNIRETKIVLRRMRSSIDFLAGNESAATSFRLANLAMETQRQWAQGESLSWRPFQLGFLLLALESSVNGEHADRDVMDLLWFPTGGGKTEAYLGLIAFVAFYRRLSAEQPDDGAGVALIMRYTLRLLTTQQFIRAAAMIFACEGIRRGRIPTAHAARLGNEPFSLGLWVGQGATPNSRQEAFDSRGDSSKPSPRQLVKCPCCRQSLRYDQQRPTESIDAVCINRDCIMSGGSPLPVWAVDEDVYAFRPTLLIGTVDKFAQIVRKPDTARLFGVGTAAQPQLVLQDELHLISGPLGTLAGLYESALDLILSANGTRPKIIGSTATIRRAPEQVRALFDRDTCQFPPPGLTADDSGFTVVAPQLPGRRYLGVTTAGRSAKFTLQAVSASLLQSAAAGLPLEDRDAYWTLVTYFNSLRELGGALVLMQDDVHDTIRLIADARAETHRSLGSVEELTSRRSQTEITDMLDTLEIPAGKDGAVDAVLATNMVSVGVDIARLGVMLVNGQPKTIAEYIQSTSRVGRGRIPGLVVPVLNNAKPRDRSHYETFRTWHSTLYREVEATSVTPFASRARDRALHAVLVAVVRHLAPGMMRSPVLDEHAREEAEKLIRKVADRAHRVDRDEQDVEQELKDRLARWVRRAPQQYWSRFAQTSLLQGAEEAATKRASGRVVGQAWPTPNTMRGVEPATPYRLAERLRKGTPDAAE